MVSFKIGDMVWHTKTKLVGKVMGVAHGTEFEIHPDAIADKEVEGRVVPAGHVLVYVKNDLFADPPIIYVWANDTLELLDPEELELVAELIRCKKLKTELNKQVKEAAAAYGRADAALLEYLDRMAKKGTNFYAGIGQVTIDGQELHPSITEENRQVAFEEIRKMGRGEIIKETIHPSTLEAFVNELDSTGVPIPQHINVFKRPKFSFAKQK